MGTILYNMLQYCSVLHNMKYLIVMHWFSDVIPSFYCVVMASDLGATTLLI